VSLLLLLLLLLLAEAAGQALVAVTRPIGWFPQAHSLCLLPSKWGLRPQEQNPLVKSMLAQLPPDHLQLPNQR
jgi:hypothetical protein